MKPKFHLTPTQIHTDRGTGHLITEPQEKLLSRRIERHKPFSHAPE